MSEDLEANESTLLVESSNAAAGASPASLDSGAETSTTTSSSSLDDIKDELNKPWPATFDRGIQILAGPILDEKDIDKYTKSPGVRARYKSTNFRRGYGTPEPPPPSAMHTPGTPAWLKKGLVRMKSLDYTFSEDNLAIPTPKANRPLIGRHQQRSDAQTYRRKILEGKIGGSGGHLSRHSSFKAGSDVDADVTKSPGFGREKQMDKQRKKERKIEEKQLEKVDQKSTTLESTFNMANILMGVGMLGLPYVFHSAGWIGGTCVTIGFCMITWRTSYYLGRELNGDPRPVHLFDDDSELVRMRKPLTSFPSIAREAFGDNGCYALSSVLYFELFSCLSIFFVSLGDHLHALFPDVSQSKHMTIVAFFLVVPSGLLRTPKLLSYLSAVGTFATVAVVLSVVLSALALIIKVGGEVDNGREYQLYSSDGLPLALGIVAYCFSGHAIVPSIHQSMKRPQEFERMIDATYGVVLLSCILVAVSGYYMFGDDVEDQITISLEQQSENSGLLMSGLTWLMILTAISKFTLTMFPLALGFEEILTGVLPSDLAMEVVDSVVKISLIFLSLAVAVFFPSFSFLCSLVGLICTMIVSVIFPALAHLRLFGEKLSLLEKAVDWALVTGGAFVAVVGTIATLKP